MAGTVWFGLGTRLPCAQGDPGATWLVPGFHNSQFWWARWPVASSPPRLRSRYPVRVRAQLTAHRSAPEDMHSHIRPDVRPGWLCCCTLDESFHRQFCSDKANSIGLQSTPVSSSSNEILRCIGLACSVRGMRRLGLCTALHSLAVLPRSAFVPCEPAKPHPQDQEAAAKTPLLPVGD
ncbi:hypothetical protein B0T25DRAFT_70662 [Lasiosphaeria hispida]|uniref:Uncharacterized protein n=1 Tax=Lasiosphaeria hispida TaxID=260671 RepID=A0AAJ0MLA7_9PEZI|nr:hypothetical protein B0T25DRAFT_70662 [Lasiosphaeria hispida]